MRRNNSRKLATAACVFMFILLVSCTKSVTEQTDGMLLTKSGSNWSTSGSSNLNGSSSYNSLSVNWNNRTDGPYGYTLATQDFKTVPFWGDQVRSQVSGGRLRTTLTKNALGGEGGVISRVDVPDGSEYQLQFDMMFDPQFDFSWGGKVGFGFLIGNGYTGGVPGTDGNGGSFRLMWYKNTSTGPVFLKP